MNPKTSHLSFILLFLLPHIQPISACSPNDLATNYNIKTMADLTNRAAAASHTKPTPPPHHASFIITNVRIFDGKNVLPSPHHVTVSNGHIKSITPTTHSPPNNLRTISGQNRTLLPGLIDSHVHFTQESELDALIESGITSALDMACFPSSLLSTIRNFSSSSDTVRPNIKSAGMPATTRDSAHAKLLFSDAPPDIFLDYTSPDEISKGNWVTKRLTEGSDYIKILVDVPGPTQEMVDGLVKESREKGRLSIAHAASRVSWGMAVQGDADLITHVPSDDVLGDEVVEQLVSGSMHGDVKSRIKAVVPTLTMSKAMASRGGANESLVKEVMGHAFETVRKLHQAGKENGGVVVLAGTDANNSPFAAVKHGESLVEELEFFVDGAGFEAVEALRSATSLPAEWWGLEGRGVIEVEAKADLLLVDGEPWKDVGVLRNVIGVWRDGRAAVLKVDSK